MTLCALHAATVMSRNCCADFGHPLTKKVMSHSRDGPSVTAPLQTDIVRLTAYPPLKSPRNDYKYERRRIVVTKIHANLVFQVYLVFEVFPERAFLEMLAVSYLVLQACISFLRCFRQKWCISVFALFA